MEAIQSMNQTRADGWRKEGDIRADKMERINPEILDGRESRSAVAAGSSPPWALFNTFYLTRGLSR